LGWPVVVFALWFGLSGQPRSAARLIYSFQPLSPLNTLGDETVNSDVTSAVGFPPLNISVFRVRLASRGQKIFHASPAISGLRRGRLLPPGEDNKPKQEQTSSQKSASH